MKYAAEGRHSLPGYGFDECRVDYEARRIYTMVRWQSKPDLSEPRGKKAKLHFEIQGAALYAYRFVRPACPPKPLPVRVRTQTGRRRQAGRRRAR